LRKALKQFTLLPETHGIGLSTQLSDHADDAPFPIRRRARPLRLRWTGSGCPHAGPQAGPWERRLLQGGRPLHHERRLLRGRHLPGGSLHGERRPVHRGRGALFHERRLLRSEPVRRRDLLHGSGRLRQGRRALLHERRLLRDQPLPPGSVPGRERGLHRRGRALLHERGLLRDTDLLERLLPLTRKTGESLRESPVLL
jgi:hypothetical protein